jgi:hypothetical protein
MLQTLHRYRPLSHYSEEAFAFEFRKGLKVYGCCVEWV